MFSRKKGFHFSIVRFVFRCLVYLVILCAIFFTVLRLSSPLLNYYIVAIENGLADELQQPIKIQKIDLSWQGRQPVFLLNNVELYNHQNKLTLHVNTFMVRMSLWKSLWHRRWFITQLSLNGAKAKIIQKQNGQIYLNNCRLSLLNNIDFIPPLLWLIQQPQTTVENIDIDWELPNGQIFKFEKMSANLHNFTDQHQLTANFIWHNETFRLPTHFAMAFETPIWRPKLDAWWIQGDYMQLKFPDINITGKGSLIWFRNELVSPLMSGHWKMTLNNVAHLPRYYLTQTMDDDLLKWLKQSLLNSQQVVGDIMMQGHLKDFPFIAHQGIFRAAMRVNDLKLHFDSQWPAIENLYADIDFINQHFYVRNVTGNLAGAKIKQLHAEIVDLGLRGKALLHIVGDMEADLAQAEKIILQSSLKKKVARYFEHIHLKGPTHLRLLLEIPLHDDDTPIHLQGNMQLLKSQLLLPAWKILINELQGKVFFTEDIIQVNNLRGLFWEHPITLNINSLPKKDFIATWYSELAANDFQSFTTFDLKNYLTGKFSYQSQLNVPEEIHKPITITLASNLKGFRSQLPMLFEKESIDQRNLKMSAILSENELTYRWEVKSNSKGFLKLNKNTKKIQANIQSKQIAGVFNFSYPLTNTPFKANLRYCKITPTDKKHDLKIAYLPDLSVNCEKFYYGKKYLGKMIFRGHKINNQMMQIDEWSAGTHDWKLFAKGDWQEDSYRQRTSLQGTFRATQLFNMLHDLQLPAILNAKIAQANFNLKFLTSPDDLSFSHLNGNLSLKLQHGEFANMGAQAEKKLRFGKLLNILSLQSLRRKLVFDFNDLKSTFEFDEVKSDFRFKNGVAYTNNLEIRGPLAAVWAKGDINCVRKELNLLLTITPKVTASLPVLAALAGGPWTGLMIYIADKVASPAVSQIASNRYHLQGLWDNPVVIPQQPFIPSKKGKITCQPI